MNHLEIEYKSGLNKEQFDSLLPLFKDITPVKQIIISILPIFLLETTKWPYVSVVLRIQLS